MFIAETFHRVSLQEVEKGAKPAEAYNYALEILITKSELEEKNGLASFNCWWHGLARNMIYFLWMVETAIGWKELNWSFFSSRKHDILSKSKCDDFNILRELFAGLIAELKQKVEESKTECAYQLRLKDNQNVEQIKEMNKKARAEKDSLSKNINALQQDIGNLTKDNEGKLQKVTQDKKNLLSRKCLHMCFMGYS